MTDTTTGEFTDFGPDFTWDDNVTSEQLKNIAEFGDVEMRRHAAAHPAITDEIGQILLIAGGADIAPIICKNPKASTGLFKLAARPRRTIKKLQKQYRAADRAAEKRRTSYVSSITRGEK